MLGSNGLSLFLVKQHLEAIGSSLEVASELGRGTTFSFTLPLLDDSLVHEDLLIKGRATTVRSAPLRPHGLATVCCAPAGRLWGEGRHSATALLGARIHQLHACCRAFLRRSPPHMKCTPLHAATPARCPPLSCPRRVRCPFSAAPVEPATRVLHTSTET